LLLALTAGVALGGDDPDDPAPDPGAADKAKEGQALLERANALRDEGRLDEAVADYRRAIELLEGGDKQALGSALRECATALSLQGAADTAAGNQARAVTILREAHPKEHHEVVSALATLALYLTDAGRAEEALPHASEAVAMARLVFGGDHPEVATSINGLALTLGALGRHAEQLPLAEEALAMWSRLFPRDHPDVATGINNVAFTLGALGRHAEALGLDERALAMRRRLFEGDHPDVAQSIGNLAFDLGALGRHAERLPLEEEALAMRRRLFNGDHPDVAAGIGNLASTLYLLGRHCEALAASEEALAVSRRLFRSDHPYTATGISNLAFILGALGRHAEALPLNEEALAMLRRLCRGDHPAVAASLNNLALTLGALGRHTERLPLAGEALAMRRRLFEGDHPDAAQSIHNLAHTLGALGRHAEALPLLEEALAMRRRLFKGDHPDVAQSINNMALVLGALGRGAEQLPLVEEALAMLRRLFKGDHPDVALSLSNLAFTLSVLGRRAEALHNFTEAADMGRRLKWQGVHLPLCGLGIGLLEADDPAGAAAPLAEAAEHAESLRAGARSLGAGEAARYSAERRRTDPYALLVEAHVALGRGDDALATLERGRARALLDLLEAGRQDTSALAATRAREAGDTGALARIEAAESAVRAAEAAVVERGDDAKRALDSGVRDEIAKTRATESAARRTLAKALRGRLNVLRDVLPETRPIGCAGIQALLAPGERMLSYSLGDRASFVLVVRPEGEPGEAIRLPAKLAEIDAACRACAGSLARRGGDGEACKRLFELVVPAKAWTEVKAAKRVFLLPHGPLHLVPFEALWPEEAPPAAYAASASVLSWLRSRKAPARSGPDLAALGDPAFGEGGASRRFDPLPGTRREVEALRGAFEGRCVVTLLGEEATEARLFDAALGARLLHIATHGIVEEAQSASLSALALTRPRVPVPGDDGLLMLGDLLERWRGRLGGCELVVLSACETQKGRLERDEGMLALPSGFLFAGARAVVASLWKVDDESTALLMTDMYKRMMGGAGACDALHLARAALRKTHPDPHHWGAFVYVGAP